MTDISRSLDDFTEVLASSSPSPGGGGAAALAGAVGTALSHMVGALTTGKKRYAATEEEMKALMEELRRLRLALLAEVDGDAAGFAPLAAAYALPVSDPEKPAKKDAGARKAMESPCRVLELCCRGVELTERVREIGSVYAVSDAGCAAALLLAAIHASVLNIYINTGLLLDPKEANIICQEIREKEDAYCLRAEKLLLSIRDQLIND